MDGELLDGPRIVEILTAIGDQLVAAGTERQTVIAVGGSYLAILGWRDATRDFDTVTRIDDALRTAVEAVAASQGVPARWLNSNALPWKPATLEVAECITLLDHPGLLVLGPLPEQIFVMKLEAGRPGVDDGDLVTLWPHCAFENPAAAVALHQAAYPASAPDEFLVEYVADIAERASAR